MGIILNTYHNFVRYTLSSKSQGEVTISEPVGWQDDSKEIVRDPKAHGKKLKTSSDLEFYDSNVEGFSNSFDYLEGAYNLDGINAEVLLTKYVSDPNDTSGNKEIVEYELTFDFSTKKIINDSKGKRIQIKSKDEGIGQKIIARQSDSYEIERLETNNGTAIPPLQFERAELEGKRILKVSELDVNEDQGDVDFSATIIETQEYYYVRTVPITIVSKSDQDVLSPILEEQNNLNYSNDGQDDGNSSLYFLVNTESQDKTVDLDIKGSYLINYDIPGTPIDLKLGIRLVKYSDAGGANSYISEDDISLQIGLPANDLTYNFDESLTVTLQPNEALSLQFVYKIKSNSNGFSVFSYRNIDCKVTITQNSFFDKTTTKLVLPFELCNRLLQIITNRTDTVLVSNFFGRTDLNYAEDGEGSLIGVTTGSLIRGFEDTEDQDKKDKRFSTSFKEFIESYTAAFNIGWSVEKIGFVEFVRVEPLKYFYQNTTTIKLPNRVANIKRTIAKEYFYSTIEIGNKKVLENEEVMGLDEPNTSSIFTTVIDRIENKFTMQHPYSSSMYDKEFARRKQKAEFPTEDTKYDQIKFFLDLKRDNSIYLKQRRWQDDFSVEPQNIFDPNSGTEYRLSPANTLLRHGVIIRTGLNKYLGDNDKVKYASSQGNSNMITNPIGGDEIKENGDIPNKNLEFPIFSDEIIEFDHEVDSRLLQQIDSKTKLRNGTTIENFYGLVEFTNEKNVQEFGFLTNLKPNKEGKFKLIGANR